MGGGILILVIMLIIWAVVSIKENMQAANYREKTKNMSYEEIRHYNQERMEKKFGLPPCKMNCQEFKQMLEKKAEEEKRVAIELFEDDLKRTKDARRKHYFRNK